MFPFYLFVGCKAANVAIAKALEEMKAVTIWLFFYPSKLQHEVLCCIAWMHGCSRLDVQAFCRNRPRLVQSDFACRYVSGVSNAVELACVCCDACPSMPKEHHNNSQGSNALGKQPGTED